jgi:hypothetical protein
MYAQPQTESARGLYRRNTDAELFRIIGTFPLIAAEEIAKLTSRPPVQVRKRLRQFLAAGYLNRIQGANEALTFYEEIECERCHHMNQKARLGGRQIATPWFWYLQPKALPYAPDGVAWREKSANIVDHDRGITLCHLALHNKWGGELETWHQQRDAMKESVALDGKTVNFYADARFYLEGRHCFLEYQHSAPSSKNGETDLDVKVARYNALLKHKKDAKVIFIFRAQNHVENFLKRIANDFPYRWLWATDMEGIKHNPSGSIFWCPKDYEERTYSFSDALV